MAAKIPPPPPIASQDPTFNRWLLELTSILNKNGNIDASDVEGLPAALTQMAANTTTITRLQGNVGGNSTSIITLQNRATVLESEVTTVNSSITSLTARNQVLNGTAVPGVGVGSNGDWYANTSGAAGSRIYVKVAGAWVALA